VDCEPVKSLLPDQVPEAIQAVAPAVDQDNAAASPELTVLGFAASLMVGAAVTTVTVVDCEELPPPPVHVSSNSLDACSGPVECVPAVAMTPLQPPEAWHLSAWVVLQVRVAISPLAMLVGAAVSVTVGAPAVTSTWAVPDAEPPGPLQVSVYVEASVSGSVVALPLVARMPDQAPEAMQFCASVELHCRVVGVFIATEVLAATSFTTGGLTCAGSSEVVVMDRPEEDSPQAAKMLIAASAIEHRKKCMALEELGW
jgi:hypothetical protein